MKEVVIWVSRHSPIPRQLTELERLFPDHYLILDPRPFSGADEIVSRYRELGGTQMVAVAPLSVVQKLVERGLQPMWAEMRQVPLGHKDADITVSGRAYHFVRFRRITNINITLEEIPDPVPPDDLNPPTTNKTK